MPVTHDKVRILGLIACLVPFSSIEADIIAPLAEAQQGAKETVREETEATKVNFFTMVRGDN